MLDNQLIEQSLKMPTKLSGIARQQYERIVFCGYWSGSGNEQKRSSLHDVFQKLQAKKIIVLQPNSPRECPKQMSYGPIEFYDYKISHMQDGSFCGNKLWKYLWGLVDLFKMGLSPLIFRDVIGKLVAGWGAASHVKRLSAVLLLCYNAYVLDRLRLSERDVVFIWPGNQLGQLLLEKICSIKGVSCIFCEYGYLPFTMYLDYSPSTALPFEIKYADLFYSLPITSSDLDNARKYLSSYRNNATVQRSAQKSKHSGSPRCDGAFVILVAGIEMVASGVIVIDENMGWYHSEFWGNAALLNAVCKICRSRNISVLYKEHPNVKHSSPALMVETTANDPWSVVDESAPDILESIDLVISFPSKLHQQALLRDKMVICIGDSPMGINRSVINAYTVRDLEYAIDECHELTGYDKNDFFLDYVARELKYSLLPVTTCPLARI